MITRGFLYFPDTKSCIKELLTMTIQMFGLIIEPCIAQTFYAAHGRIENTFTVPGRMFCHRSPRRNCLANVPLRPGLG